ncbi:MAG: hypothetical protein IPJ88_02125 [Myxococcales bacterium]|nr:MAG: hypothetical protein IPJ88_02125 [Myxococcales bacterium]
MRSRFEAIPSTRSSRSYGRVTPTEAHTLQPTAFTADAQRPQVDVSICPSCGCTMKITEFVDAQDAAGILRAPPAPNFAPQLSLPFVS